MPIVARWGAALVLALGSGCYAGLRAGPTIQSSDTINYQKFGWTVGVFVGVEATLFDRLRIAFGGDGSRAWQTTEMGKLRSGAQGIAAKVDWTLWQRRNWTKDIDGCARQYGGFRVRTGLGLRLSGEKAAALTFETEGQPDQTYAIDGSRAYDATVEIGGWKHNSNAFAGLGISYEKTDLDGPGHVNAYSVYLQILFAGTGPLKTATTWASHYHGDAEAEQRNWAAHDCSGASDPSACEKIKNEQVQAWGTEHQESVDQGARMRASEKCL